MTILKYTHLLYQPSDIENIFKPGVYKMFHIFDCSLIYIGSSNTKGKKRNQNGVYARWLHHIGLLKSKKHYCKKLQSIVDGNGLDGLRFQIIEICKDTADCKEREQYYLDKLNPSLNNSKSSTSPLGVKHSEETRARRRETSQHLRLPEYVYEKLRQEIFQFNLEGVLLCKYKSIQEASDKTQIDRGSINNCALGKRLSAGGFLWSYSNVVNLKFKRKIIKYDLNMNKISEFNTLSAVVKALNLNSSTAIRNCFVGKQKQAYGFIWKEKKP